MLFSVIMPLYNKAAYVSKAIQSILAQTFDDFELIVVDDGSKDDSASIAANAIQSHGNCSLIRQENAGVSVARNNGVAASDGEFLCFLDADDWWDPTFLEEMVKLIETFPEAGIYGTNYTIVNETKHKTRIAPIGVDPGFEKGYINYCQVYAKTLAMPLWTGAVCIPRHVFDEMKGFPKGIKLGEDFLLWVRIALKYKVAFLNKSLSYYNQDADAANRGTHGLTPPEHNFLWHTDMAVKDESIHVDYKLLIDRLRAYDLKPYYLSRDYHNAAKEELRKVNKQNLSRAMRRFYSMPWAFARLVAYIRKTASMMIRGIKTRLDNLASIRWEIGVVDNGLAGVMEGSCQISWLRGNYKDRWFADPFVLEADENKIVLLVEEYVYDQRKGRIAELVIDRSTMRITHNKTLLEKPTHLSFPAILRAGNRVFVYPENSAEGRLDLYEYRDDSLFYAGSLCNEPLTDAVITNCFGDNRMYATKMPNPNGNHIGVYHGNSLYGAYDFIRTIEFNGNDARMAGDFFEYNGSYYKPSQDCNGGYGKAIRLYETKDGIAFYHHSTLTSTHPKLREGMHTLNSYHGVVVIDVVGYRFPVAGKIINAMVTLKKRIKR